jgi:hypothetical protein
MKLWGKVMPAVALGCAVLAVAGCNPEEVVVGAREAKAAGQVAREIHIPGSEVTRLAKIAAVSTDTLGETAQSIRETRPWEAVRLRLALLPKYIDESTDEKVRAVVAATACDMFFERMQGKTPDLAGDLQKNALEAGYTPSQEMAQAAGDVYTTLWDDHADGDEKDEAAVSAGCYIVNTSFEHMVHQA